MVYPLKFKSIFKERIWGGNRLKEIFGKDTEGIEKCGESWEISGVKGDVSVVSEGSLKGKALDELVKTFKGQLVGERIYKQFGDEFPLLIKFLDAAADLSVQVHPNDEMAKIRHNGKGKTEMWYVFHAEEDASLIAGFNRPLTKELYKQAVEENKLNEILNRVPVTAGDTFYVPAGRVHYIGKGIMLAEIQQTSDITYRIYDFDRVDAHGNKRELHVEQALDAIDFKYIPEVKSLYEMPSDGAATLVDSPFFTTNRIQCVKEITRDHSNLDSFKIYICFEGSGRLKTDNYFVNISKGDAILVPATSEKVNLIPSESLGLLECFINK